MKREFITAAGQSISYELIELGSAEQDLAGQCSVCFEIRNLELKDRPSKLRALVSACLLFVSIWLLAEFPFFRY